MSNLVPDSGDRSDSQITPNDRDSPDLYFQELIVQQQNSLTPTTDLDEYKKRLEIIQMAIDLSEKKTNIERKATQDAINLEIAKIELSDRQIRSTEVKFKTIFKIVAIPAFIGAGIYIWYTSDSILGSALLFLGLRLALSNEDAMKSINTIKDLLSK
ncbi:hypothetical protein [Chamaesiphon minutus]|uniref:Uncharacterized protein n=1 Tax=Chamaesiphon minutus (strain ATCC 27169 / PCC 6605) TaxID=1173020 RepID=K9UI61_CHAP6|nr:hypothetical protein [Chamaesiphon minutus]AFY94505.1 hypothetical protein Cha6605_3515 [Chamaesiphon minutus PCC 6605]